MSPRRVSDRPVTRNRSDLVLVATDAAGGRVEIELFRGSEDQDRSATLERIGTGSLHVNAAPPNQTGEPALSLAEHSLRARQEGASLVRGQAPGAAMTVMLGQSAPDLHARLEAGLSGAAPEFVRAYLVVEPETLAANLPWEDLQIDFSPPFRDGRCRLMRWHPDPARRRRGQRTITGATASRLRVLALVGDFAQEDAAEFLDHERTRRTRDQVVELVDSVRTQLGHDERFDCRIVGPAWPGADLDGEVDSIDDVERWLRGDVDDPVAQEGFGAVVFVGHSDAGEDTAIDQRKPATAVRFRFPRTNESGKLTSELQTLSFDALRDALTYQQTGLLLLNACWLDDTMARRLLEAVPHVVGYGAMVPVGMTPVVTGALIDALAGPDPKSVDDAVQMASQVAAENWGPWQWMLTHHGCSTVEASIFNPEDVDLPRYRDEVSPHWLKLPAGLDGYTKRQRVMQDLYVDVRLQGPANDGPRSEARAGDRPDGLAEFDATIGHDGELVGRHRLLDLVLDIRRNRRFVVIGEPGSGKSTLLRQLGVELLDRDWLVVYVTVQQLLDHRVNSLDAIRQLSLPGLGRVGKAGLGKAAARGRLTLLIDGFDEARAVEGEVLDEVVTRTLAALDTDVGRGCIVVASRPADTLRFDDAFVWTEVCALDAEQKRALLRNWFQLLRQRSRRIRCDWLDRFDSAEAATDAALEEIHPKKRPALHQLCGNPLALTLTAIRVADEGFREDAPTRRHGVLLEFVDFLLAAKHRDDEPFQDKEAPRRLIRRLLSRIALRMLIDGSTTIALLDDDYTFSEVGRHWLQTLPQDLRDATIRGPIKREGRSDGHPVSKPLSWAWTDPESKAERTIADRLQATGIWTPAEEPFATFPIQSIGDVLAAEALVEQWITDGGGVAALLEWLANRKQQILDHLPRFAETLALVTSWLETAEDRTAWLRGLAGIDGGLGLRALGLCDNPPPEVIAGLIEGTTLHQRRTYWEGFLERFNVRSLVDAEAAVQVLVRVAGGTSDGVDRFFLEELAHDLTEGREKLEITPLVEAARSGCPTVEGLGKLRFEPTGEPLWRRIDKLGQEQFGYGDDLKPTPIPDPFWMMSVPVTVGMYGLFDPAHRQPWRGNWYQGAKRTDEDGTIHRLRDDLPVTNVSWFAAIAYTRWLNAVLLPEIRAGNLLPELQSKANQDDYRFRLPTEREWEWACRAGTTTDYWCGDKLTESVAWFDKDWQNDGVRPVGEGDPNPHFGLREMHGNVREWCADASSAEPAESVVRLSGRGSVRVLRGGAYDGTAERCRSAARYRFVPAWGDIDDVDGFRPVFAAPLPSSDRAIEDRS